jgi:hypothetical protein
MAERARERETVRGKLEMKHDAVRNKTGNICIG